MQYLCKCDKCGKIDEMKTRDSSGYYETPKYWGLVDTIDLCQDCYEQYQQKLKEFLKK